MPQVANNWNFVLAAYGVTWAVIIGYWVHVHRTLRQAKLDYQAALAAGGK
jgi:hypothetical protein